MKDLYRKKSNTCKKGIEDNRKRKGISSSWTGKINIEKMAILLKTIYKFSAILINMPMPY